MKRHTKGQDRIKLSHHSSEEVTDLNMIKDSHHRIKLSHHRSESILHIIGSSFLTIGQDTKGQGHHSEEATNPSFLVKLESTLLNMIKTKVFLQIKEKGL